jgi:hypothetical protein
MKQHQHQNALLPFSPIRCFFYLIGVVLVLMLVLILTPFHGIQQEPDLPPDLPHLGENNLRKQEPISPPQVIDPIIPTATYPPKMKPTIAYAITVTKDGPFVDGALVLGFAAKKYHSFSYGVSSGYKAELVAFVTKQVKTSREVLSRFGWRIIEKDLPVAVSEIENQDYAQRMVNSGCCGADEFLKLWAFTLTEYHRVVHLDMDSIVFKNMDELYHQDYELLFTGDYNMIAGSPFPPAQGGFFVIRPSLETFQEFQSIIRKGDHRPGSGWGGSHIGNFWGGQTIQGIIPYYYNILHPGKAKELNRCEYNCMVDNPYHKGTTKCLDRQPTCEDCRLREFPKVSSAHFTICQKPWTCTFHSNPKNKVLCEQFHKEWFSLRDEYETLLKIDKTSYRAKKTRYIESQGMCRGYGDDKYLPIPVERVRDEDIPREI